MTTVQSEVDGGRTARGVIGAFVLGAAAGAVAFGSGLAHSVVPFGGSAWQVVVACVGAVLLGSAALVGQVVTWYREGGRRSSWALDDAVRSHRLPAEVDARWEQRIIRRAENLSVGRWTFPLLAAIWTLIAVLSVAEGGPVGRWGPQAVLAAFMIVIAVWRVMSARKRLPVLRELDDQLVERDSPATPSRPASA